LALLYAVFSCVLARYRIRDRNVYQAAPTVMQQQHLKNGVIHHQLIGLLLSAFSLPLYIFLALFVSQ
jgi:hypothetical protein